MKPSALLAALVLSLGVGAFPVLAADAPTAPTARQLELAHRYIELIHIDRSYAETMKSLVPAILATMPKGKGSDPELQKQIFEASSEAASEMMVTLVKKMEPVMAETYSEQELADLVVFYESKTGRALVEKQPLMVSRMAPLIGEIMPEFQANLKTKICVRIDCKALEKQ